MRSLEKLYFQENYLTGKLPAEWFSAPNAFPNLLDVDVRWNNLHGPVFTLNNGSSFPPVVNRSIHIYVSPMGEGFGLCKDSPSPDTVLFESQSHDSGLNRSNDGLVTILPSCSSGKAHHNLLDIKTCSNVRTIVITYLRGSIVYTSPAVVFATAPVLFMFWRHVASLCK
jgi:hypothetical protein